MSTTAVEKPRQVARKFLARPQHEGVGAVVRRSIGRFELRYFDPFLVLDEFSVSAPAGFPDHPHRGFETVTYMLEVWSREPRGLRGPPWHDQGRRRAVDDGRPRHRALRDAGRPRHLQGPPALGQPRLPKQNDRAEVPGDAEQGHRVDGVGRRRRDGARDRGAGHGRPVAGEHADAHHVPGLHGAPARRRAGAAAGAGVVERVRLRARGRRRVRGSREGPGGRASPGAARAGRRRRGGVEQVRQAAPVRAHRRRAHRGARGAARPVRHEHRGGDRRHRQRFRVLHQWVREGQALEVPGDDGARRRVGSKNGTPRTLAGDHISCTRLFIYLFYFSQTPAIDLCTYPIKGNFKFDKVYFTTRLFPMYSPRKKKG